MKRPIRRAPKSGYDFGNKRQYRRDLWPFFRDNLIPGAKVSDVHALLMPSVEGDEVRSALEAGFSRHNLHVVDRSPAIVATLTRKYPGINTYGVSVDRAIWRIRDETDVALGVCNFDFTSCVSLPLWGSVSRINRSGILGPGTLVAMTLLRGREHQSQLAQIDMMAALPFNEPAKKPIRGAVTRRDLGRIRVMQSALEARNADGGDQCKTQVVRFATYSSGKQTMLWFVCRLRYTSLREFAVPGWVA